MLARTVCIFENWYFPIFLPHLSKVICLLMSLTLDKGITALGGRREAFLNAVFAKLAISFSFMPLCAGHYINLINSTRELKFCCYFSYCFIMLGFPTLNHYSSLNCKLRVYINK